MSIETMSISMEESLAAAVRVAARSAGQPISAWLAEAAQTKLAATTLEKELAERRSAALAEFLDEYQAQYGAFTDEEIAAAERRLGYHKHHSGAA